MLPRNRPPTHPGKMLLAEFIEPMGLTQKEFANHLNWTYARLNEIINEHRGISVDSALSLADAFNMEPEFWLNLQHNWDLWHALRWHKKVKFLKKAA